MPTASAREQQCHVDGSAVTNISTTSVGHVLFVFVAQMEISALPLPATHRSVQQNIITSIRSKERANFPIIVHSHLPWDWVWQRPQQFHSRLSQTHPILFVEGPAVNDLITHSQMTLREVPDYPNLVVLRMEMPAARFWSDGAWVDAERRRILQSVLQSPLGRKFENPVQWFYDPMATTAFANHMNEQAIVYDCMDELAQFKDAPRDLVLRERELLAAADIVFAGGPKICQAKRRYNSNAYSYGCGVDVAHFAKARHARTRLPKEVAKLTGPVLGYFGVIDERLDYELIAQLADHDPNWNVVMVGPCAKVHPETLPKRANLHWLGARDYAVLPAYVKSFDVCLMPFALNEATEFINPTKALEYMASGRPIVSTEIEDVALQYDHVVGLASSRETFVAQCAEAVQRPDEKRIRRGVKLARQNSWDSIVAQLERHVEDVLAQKRAVATNAA